MGTVNLKNALHMSQVTLGHLKLLKKIVFEKHN